MTRNEAHRIRVAINGAHGRMGTLACATLANEPQFEVVAKLGRQDNLREALAQQRPDVVLDLTSAHAVRDNAQAIVESGCRAVIGTSGLLDADLAELRELVETRGNSVLVVPNFSVSAALMLRFSEMAARYLPNAEIIELHHAHKIDSPSATALATADVIAGARTAEVVETPTDGFSGVPSARGTSRRGVRIHSVRLPGFVAHQEVLLSSASEWLTIRSDVVDRVAYANGIVLACRTIMQLTGLHVGLAQLL